MFYFNFVFLEIVCVLLCPAVVLNTQLTDEFFSFFLKKFSTVCSWILKHQKWNYDLGELYSLSGTQ